MSLHEELRARCGSVLKNCVSLSNATSARCTEDEMMALARASATPVVEIGTLVNTLLAGLPQDDHGAIVLEEGYVLEYHTRLRESVVVLVKHARNLHSNPLDFMTNQALQNTLKEVAETIKSLLEAAKGLYYSPASSDLSVGRSIGCQQRRYSSTTHHRGER